MARKVGGEGRRRRPTSRSGRPVLDPDRIARTGLELLAEEGAGALTMARVARELDVTARAIYHWVPSRRDLLEAIVAKAQQSLPLPEATGDWRADLTRYRNQTFAWMDSFPGVTDLILSEELTVVTPQVMRAQEAGLKLLHGIGLPSREALIALSEFARWVGAAHHYGLTSAGPVLQEEVAAESNRVSATSPGTYPLMEAAGTVPSGEQLERGFGWLLDSIERLAAETSPGDLGA